MDDKVREATPRDAQPQPVRRHYTSPKLQDFGRLHLMTGGASVTGMADGSSGMAMQ